MSDDNRTPADRFQAAMMDNDWLCDSTVGHEVGTCLGCITVALAATGLEARVAQQEAENERLLGTLRTLWEESDNYYIANALREEVLAALTPPGGA